MANFLSRILSTIAGGAVIQKFSGAGTDGDPAVPHVIQDFQYGATADRNNTAVSTTPLVVASASATRCALIFCNPNAGTVFMHPDTDDLTSTNYTIALFQGDSFIVPRELVRLEWRALRESGSADLVIVEVSP